MAIAWISVRFALLALEVASRPLYPWDAWIQWATKSRVWYELGRIAPFARAEQWFGTDGAVYFDASPEYPPTMPLLQVWSCLLLGRWDDTLMNWPWWQIGVALTLLVYGALRQLEPMHLGTHWRVSRRVAAARQRPRRAGRLRRPTDGRVLHLRRARVAALDRDT